MDCLSPSSPVEKVVFMKGAQIGGTEAGNNWIGYVIHHAPGPMLAVQPTVEMAKRWSKQRIASLIDSTPVLRERVKEARARDSGNTVQSKEFSGGILVMTGANSAVGLRSMPVRYLFLDEVDAYDFDVDGEGDPVSLASQRTITFANRKIFLVSTPTIQGLSRIELEYEASDRRRWWIPCPECQEYQVLEEKRLQWPKDHPEEAAYFCAHCGVAIPSHRKVWMNSRGEWRADAPGEGKAAGFHLSGLNSPWLSWTQIAERRVAAKDDAAMKVYVNTIEARTWTESGEAPEWQRLYDRREDYRIRQVPEGGLFLTAGVDVQKDRIELEIVAWGRDRESWSIDYRVLQGDPVKPDVWKQLDDVLAETFTHISNTELAILRLAIDTGYATQEVYDWVRRQSDRVIAIKGVDRLGAAIGTPGHIDVTSNGKRKRRGLLVWPVGSSFCKSELYGCLRKDTLTDEQRANGDKPPAGFCHFPKHGEEYFKQLTAERLVTIKDRRGFPRREWRKMRERNEALDCRIYARAAAAALGIDRFGETTWQRLEQALGRMTPRHTDAPEPPKPTQTPSTTRRVIRSNYL
jgi:phage terminase large subunit GpA-like protein